MINEFKSSAAPEASLRFRAEQLTLHEIAFIHNPEFHDLTLEDVINDCPEEVYAASTEMSQNPETHEMSTMLEGPLLTPAGERWLFQKMNFLRYRANHLRTQLNPRRPKRALVEQLEECIQHANATRSAIVEANTRLVASIAQRFANSRTDYEELISEGNLILLNAVDKFDYSRGFRFSTYATHSVQRHFYRLIQRRQRRKNRELSTPTEVLSDVAPNRDNDQPLDHRVAESLISRFEDCLDEREAMIIRERFGLDGRDSSETLKVVAERVGLSKERVRQLQMRAIEKLQDLAIQMKLRLEPSF